MKSAIYEGVVTHRRHSTPATGHVEHGFDNELALAYVYLDELDEFVRRHPLCSSTRANALWFRRADYLGDPARSLEDAVRDVVEERLGTRPMGDVAMLGQLRTWGWLFNPLTLYYCFGEGGTRVEAIVMEVTSTPWHERHVYVLDTREEYLRFKKEMHVSPFLGMDQDYVVSWSEPGARLRFHVENRQGDERLFDAALNLRRRDVSRRELARMIWRRPLQSYGVSAGIYRQALALYRKGAPFHSRRPPVAVTRTTCPVASRSPRG